LKDNSTPAAAFEPSRLKKIGSIRVTVYRAEKTKLAVPHAFDGIRPKVLNEVPEQSLKGTAIKNNVK
jgi:hypothetical protein